MNGNIAGVGMMALGLIAGTAIFLVILGIVFFMVNLFIIKTASNFFGYVPTADMVILTAGLLSAASMIGAKKN